MNYSTLTPEISAMCRDALMEEDPYYFIQDKENFGTVHEMEKIEAEQEFQYLLTKNIFAV